MNSYVDWPVHLLRLNSKSTTSQTISPLYTDFGAISSVRSGRNAFGIGKSEMVASLKCKITTAIVKEQLLTESHQAKEQSCYD